MSLGKKHCIVITCSITKISAGSLPAPGVDTLPFAFLRPFQSISGRILILEFRFSCPRLEIQPHMGSCRNSLTYKPRTEKVREVNSPQRDTDGMAC